MALTNPVFIYQLKPGELPKMLNGEPAPMQTIADAVAEEVEKSNNAIYAYETGNASLAQYLAPFKHQANMVNNFFARQSLKLGLAYGTYQATFVFKNEDGKVLAVSRAKSDKRTAAQQAGDVTLALLVDLILFPITLIRAFLFVASGIACAFQQQKAKQETKTFEHAMDLTSHLEDVMGKSDAAVLARTEGVALRTDLFSELKAHKVDTDAQMRAIDALEEKRNAAFKLNEAENGRIRAIVALEEKRDAAFKLNEAENGRINAIIKAIPARIQALEAQAAFEAAHPEVLVTQRAKAQGLLRSYAPAVRTADQNKEKPQQKRGSHVQTEMRKLRTGADRRPHQQRRSKAKHA